VSNAFKFTQQGRIIVSQRSANGAVELTVEDTGNGIPAAELGNVFKRFHRVENARGRTIEGTGIGLALVTEAVKLHGGKVRAESIEGRGSTFTVIIPLGTSHLPPESIRAEDVTPSPTLSPREPFLQEAMQWIGSGTGKVAGRIADVSGSASGGIRPCVLLADDNADMREYVGRMLSSRYEVVAVNDGLAALAAIRERMPDLVLSDVMMPGLDGFGLLQELRQDPQTRAVPFVMLSARAGEESRVEGLEAGVDDYLVKPFSGKELLARVATNLELAKIRLEVAVRQQEAVGARRLLEAERDARMQAEAAATALRESQQRLEDAQRQLADALDGGEIATWLWVVGTDRVYGDRNLLAMHELPVHYLEQGMPAAAYAAAIHPDDRSRVMSLLDRAIATESVFAAEYRIGTGMAPRWVYARARVERDGDGKAQRMAGTVLNVTERKHAELERERLLEAERIARNEAEQAGRMKDEFLATLSHELRTPLNAILGWSQILRSSSSADPDDIKQGLETIERNARAQTAIIEDLLDMSRIISGKVRLDVQRVDLAPVVQAAVDTVRPAADAKGVRLQVVLDPLAGPVAGDPNRLQQVFWNLLSNAVKFTPRGGRVQVLLERVNSHLEISVIDTGEGITPDFLPFVFDRFRQSDGSSTRRHGGLGLGLAIVKQLVEMHGGSVRAKSPGAGHGATFSVSLPLTVVHADSGPSVTRRHPSTATVPVMPNICDQIAGMKILVVDDEPDARALVKRLLEDCNAEVVVAASAAEAMDRLMSHRPDVLVSDIGMPGEDGLSLIRRVRALPPERGGNIPAVALTAYARAEDRMNAVVAGFQHHVAKPVEPAELITMVASLGRR
jgi:signal transduction histidine kinase/DNA-binding response OmpR family regulator